MRNECLSKGNLGPKSARYRQGAPNKVVCVHACVNICNPLKRLHIRLHFVKREARDSIFAGQFTAVFKDLVSLMASIEKLSFS